MSTPIARPTIAVWFSCGAASACAAKFTVERYGKRFNVRVVNTPMHNEDADNRRFLADVEQWIGQRIESAHSPKFPTGDIVEVFDAKKYMSGPDGAPCTGLIKKAARQHWSDQFYPALHVMGFTVEERNRHDRHHLTEQRTLLPVLIDEGLTKADCFALVHAAGIQLPLMYRLGYPNANCIGCVKAQSPTYWNHVRRHHPAVFERRAEQSHRIGCKLVLHKGKRIYLHELPADAIGRPMKTMQMECGVFCSE